MARPKGTKIQIDKASFENCLRIQCTREECCSWFMVSKNTLVSWVKNTYGMKFEEVAEIYRGQGRVSQRRNLYKLAERNASVAIFLAKNELGMSDMPVAIDTGEDQKSFAESIKKATKAMDRFNIEEIADIPIEEPDEQ